MAVAPSDSTGGFGGCAGLELELELELGLELESNSGVPAAAAISSARLASVASAVRARPRIDGDGVTGSVLLPLPVPFLPFTTIMKKEMDYGWYANLVFICQLWLSVDTKNRTEWMRPTKQ
jgi:hypothetical protein